MLPWERQMYLKMLLNWLNEEKERIISSLPATKLMALQTFFLLGHKQLTKATTSSLVKMERHLRMKAYLQVAGRIISGYKMRVMKTLLKWMKLSKNHLGKY